MKGKTMGSDRLSMQKVFICIMLLVPIFVVFSGNKAATEISILAEDAFLPFSDSQGNGMSNDIVRAAFKAVGLDIQLKVYPFPRLMHMVKKGEAPGGFNAVPTSLNKEEYIFGKHPIYISHQRFYYSLGHPMVIDTERDISEKLMKNGIVVGEVLGYIYPPAYESLKNPSGKGLYLKTEDVKSDDRLIKKLIAGRNRVALMTSEVVNYHLKRMNLTGKIGFGNFSWEAPLYIAFSKKHPKGAFLSDMFDQGMDIIKKNGTYDRIIRQYTIME